MKLKTKFVLSFVLLGFTLTSCIVTSLNPLFSEDQLIFNKSFIGTWLDTDSTEWNISAFNGFDFGLGEGKKDSIADKEAPKAYYLKLKDNKSTGNFILGLIKLDDNFFVDFYPDIYSNDPIKNEFYTVHRLPVHSFGKALITDTLIKIQRLNYDWLNEYAKSTDALLDMQELETGTVITSSTEEIQRFLIKYADNKDVFSDAIVLRHKSL